MVEVVLVDTEDNPKGTMEKMEAHRKGVLHRAFSVFVFNDKGQLMLQQRALHKYHSPGLWSNTCCSHPYPGEAAEMAAHRRLVEEMGFDCDLHHAFSFVYRAELDQGMTEHELDHVFIGHANAEPMINPEEVNGWKWVDVDHLVKDIEARPEDYTVWFRIIFKEFRKNLDY
jgi:isopentenyl-diphosphate delta-isomerase